MSFPEIQNAGLDNIIPFLVMGVIWWLSNKAEKKARKQAPPVAPPRPVPQPRDLEEEDFDPFAIFRHPQEIRQERQSEPLEPESRKFAFTEEVIPLEELEEPVRVTPKDVPLVKPRRPAPTTRRSTLQSAVVWAEILGKPVALRD